MPELLTPLRLGPKQVDQAFPIVQSLMPRLSIDDWRDFATRLGQEPSDRAGIMTVQSQGYIHGLFSYTVAPHLVHRQVLSVDNIVVVDLFTPGAVAEALLRALDQLAAELNCRIVQSVLPEGSRSGQDYRDWLVSRLYSHGHRAKAVALRKCLADAAPEASWGDDAQKSPRIAAWVENAE